MKVSKSFIGKSIIIIAVLAALATLLSISAQYVSPAKFWPPALFGLGFKHFYIVNIGFLMYFLLRRRATLIIPSIALIVGYPTARTVLQSGFSTEKVEEEDSIKVLSYNVRLFDLYNWTENLQTRQKILNLLSQEDADILCLQEFYNANDNKFENIDTLLASQKASHYHVEYQKSLKEKYHFGIATFSVYPIVNKGQITFSEDNTNVCIYTDLKIDGDTVRVFNAHLESIRFKQEDYEFIDKITEGEENFGKELKHAGTIVNRLKTAYVKRSAQAERIVELVKSSPHPVILCGDFNDSPTSYCYKVLSDELQDAFMRSGRGLGNTYTGPFPAFRIDFIMHSDDIESGDYKTTRQALSDHYPVSCRISLKK